MQTLEKENKRLSDKVDQAESAEAFSKKQLFELLGLRSEVGMLRNRIEKAEAVNPAETELPNPTEELDPIEEWFSQPENLARATYSMAQSGQLDNLKKALDSYPELLNLPVGGARSTMLHTAAYNSQPEVVKELLLRGAEIDVQNRDLHTPLFDCVTKGTPESVVMLLEAGADVSIPDKNGITPLQMAEMKGREDVVVLLREWGAQE